MERRTAIKIVALSALAPRLGASQAVGLDCPMPKGTAWTPTAYKLRFFTEAENDLLGRLMEMIIPADSHSPGAHAAQVNLFADLMVATSEETTRSHWRNGLALIQEEARKSSLSDALARAAALSETPHSALGRFFMTLKQMTVNGYYTSEIGIHQDLEYLGNTYVAAFPGCDHPEHQQAETQG
jgi:glucoside 3-dehydrogenase (cytochrome c) hitch-hiker subunit